ncbi:hypothetical protein P175DRAFT_022776 [Aspergillus ochraceoroseus IBT 24754]|uniref:Meiotic nuclear division protein 1 n=1 Tax=Aspergillus ochraceoroseus IBT 24754 TaxID=1392256 RepID=A0A2T5M6N8_9EURO|nr:uncharacterized protein P175DRAFT_022776 [Aspergillus ochraceoroseus IBT 24754]PTU24194.1 hypothetical protein P175DRAFT_022776 [Aspergillus ochraceoroseus IBT 24754]
MPPKLSKSAKQALIVSHLRATRTCHTLKDLEKTLPSVASINGMQVKEYIQELTDEGQICVEKIGSGNWYWSFGGDETRAREAQLGLLLKEVERARGGCVQVEGELRRRREEKERLPEGHEEAEADERKGLVTRKRELALQRDRLQGQWTAAFTTGEGKGIGRMRQEAVDSREKTLAWTDNIYVLEEYVRKLAGGDREVVEAVQRECYGEEYVEGEGLRELE